MTISGAAGFDDLDDPSPPVPGASHRVAVDRRLRRYRHRRQLMAGGLAVAIVFGAMLTAVNLRTPAPATHALGAAPSAGPDQVYWPSAGTPGLGSAPRFLSPLGPSTGAQGDLAGTTATATAGAGAGAGASAGQPSPIAGPSQDSLPGTTPACPTPIWAGGSYCGPSPQPGNGGGPGGRCSGHETAPPCGPGAVVGTYYPYTLPVRCDELITFNGRRWTSDLLPPAKGPDLWVWMRLAPGGHLRFVGPVGTIGFTPGRGDVSPHCGSPG